MTEHTPGPWTYTSTGEIYLDDDGPLATQLATVTHAPVLPNASLIAAAPDLLEAAKFALQYLKHPDVQALQFALPASNAARSLAGAIAKAEGP